MRVTVTRDSWDGTKSKSKTMDLEDLDTSSIAFMLMGANTASITITKFSSLSKMARMVNESGKAEMPDD